MAIVVKHGSPQVGLLSEFGEGQARQAMEAARLVGRPTGGIGRNAVASTVDAPKKPETDKITGKKVTAEDALLKPPSEKRYSGSADMVAVSRALDAGDAQGAAAILEQQQAQAMLRMQQKHELDMAQKGYVTSEYSQKQVDEYNKLSEAYADAVSSGEYTPEELQQIKRQIDAKRMGIEPVEKIKKPQPFQEGRNIGDVWQDESGLTLTRDKDGNVKKIADAPAPEKPEKKQDDIDINKIYAEVAKEVNPTTGEPISADEAMKKTEERVKAIRAIQEKLNPQPTEPVPEPQVRESLGQQGIRVLSPGEVAFKSGSASRNAQTLAQGGSLNTMGAQAQLGTVTTKKNIANAEKILGLSLGGAVGTTNPEAVTPMPSPVQQGQSAQPSPTPSKTPAPAPASEFDALVQMAESEKKPEKKKGEKPPEAPKPANTPKPKQKEKA